MSKIKGENSDVHNHRGSNKKEDATFETKRIIFALKPPHDSGKVFGPNILHSSHCLDIMCNQGKAHIKCF